MMVESSGGFTVSDFKRVYFGRYPFRVRINNPHREMGRHPLWNGDLNTVGQWTRDTQARHSRYLEKNHQFLEEVLTDFHVPEDEWMRVTTTATHSFYFANRDAFDEFVELNGHLISDVEGPKNDGELERVFTQFDATPVMRNRLFWDQYEWKIVFRRDESVEAEIDDWMSSVIEGDVSRALYNRDDSQRILYLTDDCDLCVVRLAHYSAIERVEQAILRGEPA